MSSAGPATSSIRVMPVFFKHNCIFPHINKPEENTLRSLEVFNAARRSVGNHIFGAQRIRNLWRIYFKEGGDALKARANILTKGMSIRSMSPDLFDKNPYTIDEHDASRATRDNYINVTFKDIPLSYDNGAIEAYLETNHPDLVTKGGIKYSCERNETNHLTECRNGDRFVAVVAPIDPPLPKSAQIGIWTCRIYHKGQATKVKCNLCKKEGHKAGTKECAFFKEDNNITLVNGHTNIMSNFHPSDAECDGRVFKSVEHAYAFRKAYDNGHHDMAEEAADAEHAGKAKKISQGLDDLIGSDWDTYNVELMENLIRSKAERHPEFVEALIESGETIIAHSVPDLFWGTGLSPKLSQYTDPMHWPGKNVFGTILHKIRRELISEKHDIASVNTETGVMADDGDAEDSSADESSTPPRNILIRPAKLQFKPLVQSTIQFTPKVPPRKNKRPEQETPPSAELNRNIKAIRNDSPNATVETTPDLNLPSPISDT